MERPPTPHCYGCGRHPDQIDEYIAMAEQFTMEEKYEVTPTEFVISEEGTYNPRTEHFWCTNCYIKAGTPNGLAP